jgi:hypothetical protein
VIAMMIDLKGDTETLRKAYKAINDELQRQEQFDGLIVHTAGPTATGWRIVDVWRSNEDFDLFAQRMVPLAQKSGMTIEARPEVWELENSMNLPTGS